MKIEVGKKYQDYDRPEWTLDVLQDLGKRGFMVLYPSGYQTVVSRMLIEALYKPFEETECTA